MRTHFHTVIAWLSVLLVPWIVLAQDQRLNNPTKFNDIQSFIAAFLKAVVQISLPILTLWIVYAGFLFVIARGNPGKIAAAKRNLLYVILASILILGAWVFATLIGATASQVLGA